jgi:glutathione S-transferase
MASQYKLISFRGHDRAGPIRVTLAYAKVPYEDVRLDREEWPKHKGSMPWGQVPVLEADGVKLAQVKAIASFIGRRHGVAGETDLDQAKCDEYLNVLADLRQEPYKWRDEADPVKKAEVKKSIEEKVIPGYFSNFQAIIEKNGNGVLVGKKVTFADIFLVDMVEKMGSEGIDMSKFPALQKHTELVNSQPGIKEWLGKA